MSDERSWLAWFRQVRGAEWYIVLTVCVGLATDTFIYGVIVPVVPTTLTQRAGVDLKDVQKWISALLAAFGATLMIGSPILGYICDRLRSYRKLFLFGLVAVAASTIMFMVGVSPVFLVIARALQGLSSAVLGVVGLAFMADSVDDSRIGSVMGYAAIALTWGLLLGPILGGIIFEKAGYLAVFAIPIVLVAIDIFLRVTCIEKSTTDEDQLGTANVRDEGNEHQPLLASHGSGQSAETSPHQTGTIGTESEIGGSGAAPGTSRSQNTGAAGSVAWQLIKNPRLITAVLLLFVDAMIFTSFESTLPLFVQKQYHWSPSKAGALFLVLCGPSLFGSLFGKLTDRVGSKIPALVGVGLAGLSLLVFRFVIHQRDETGTTDQAMAAVPSYQPYILIVLLALIGFGNMAFQVIGMAETSRVIGALGSDADNGHESEQSQRPVGMGQAYALSNIGYAGGQFVGPLFGGFVKERFGFATMNTILGAMVLCAAVPTAIFTGGRLKHKESVRETA